jgi:hypothetical protein
VLLIRIVREVEEVGGSDALEQHGLHFSGKHRDASLPKPPLLAVFAAGMARGYGLFR